MAAHAIARYRVYLRQRPVILAVFTVLAIVLFLAVTGISRAHQARRHAIGEGGPPWDRRSESGTLCRGGYRFPGRTASSPDEYCYQLELAEALIHEGHRGPALAYLTNLSFRSAIGKFVTSALAIGWGYSLGPEDPSLQMFAPTLFIGAMWVQRWAAQDTCCYRI